MKEDPPNKYRWYILALGTLTHIFASAIPHICMPVLFSEISHDLGLSLVQIGTIWGISSLSGLITSFMGGLLGDRFGTRRTLIASCLLAGLFGALRGVSTSFISLSVTMFLFGFTTSGISLMAHKAAGIWFPKHQLGLANGILSTGMGVGVTLGAFISATFMSPLLGGWRNVLYLYGGICIIIAILWLFSPGRPESAASEESENKGSFREALAHVIRIRSIWILAVSGIFFSGCSNGMTGYLPLFLRNSGWTPVSADGALSLLSVMGMLGAIPFALLSDRIGSRKIILIVAQSLTLIGIGLLAVANSHMVWIIMAVTGIFREALPAVMITLTMEIKGIGSRYAGTALGLRSSIGQIGGFIAPPLGNSLAGIHPGLPFIFWASLAVASVVLISTLKEAKQPARQRSSA
jgi:NNP family nitrate/nitrite transporter-like MFS transporter